MLIYFFGHQAQSNPYVKHATQLEQYLMEGAYRKVLASQNTVPAESFKYFMDCLTSTVREEIASCSEKAYQYLRVKDAKDIMLFKNEKEVLAYATEVCPYMLYHCVLQF
jgi:26S proteasome regulatory subunit N12